MPLRIVFLGTSPFAIPSLQALAADGAFRVDAVITQPDRPVGRKQSLTPPPVKEAALALGLRVLQPAKIRTEWTSLGLERPAFLVVVSYGQLLPEDLLAFPQTAPVNVHASLLPRWRGASPLQHALLAGDAETGVTVQQMVRGLDAGPILSQERTPIDPRETTPLLHDRLAQMGATLLRQTLLSPLHPVPQPQGGVTLCGKLTREDGVVDPSTMTAEEIDRRIRALTPWPGVTLPLKNETLKILETSLEAEPESITVPCADGTTLHLLRVQPAGKNPMSATAWARGRH